jgi:hypothetical protein
LCRVQKARQEARKGPLFTCAAKSPRTGASCPESAPRGESPLPFLPCRKARSVPKACPCHFHFHFDSRNERLPSRSWTKSARVLQPPWGANFQPCFFVGTVRGLVRPVHAKKPGSFDPPNPKRTLRARARARVLLRKSEPMREAEARRLRSVVRSDDTRRLRQYG